MDITNTPYWILEFIKVLLGYLVVEFLWPRLVFNRHLSGKSMLYQFSFCVTVQTVLINTVVLGLGLLHILNQWVVRTVFWGVPLILLYRRLGVTEEKAVSFADRLLVFRFKLLFKRLAWAAADRARRLWRSIRPHLMEYLLLGGVAVYALIYLSWGAFQTCCYGFGDQYVHHSWCYGLMEGQPFSGGIYPEAMHCLLYTINTVLGVQIFSLVLFFGSIQGVVFLIASYCLCRELFGWRYTPILMLAAFILLVAIGGVEVTGMARLQFTLPQEFGFAPQMLCVMYFIRYLRAREVQKPFGSGRLAGFFLEPNLFLFMMALAATIASHFYPTITAFFMCLGVSIFYLRRVFSKKRFLSLALAVLCGVLIAVTPMMGALASGIKFQGSMGWALNVIQGTGEESRQIWQETEHVGQSQQGEHPLPSGNKIGTALGKGFQILCRGYAEVIGTERTTFYVILLPVILLVCLLLKFIIHLLKGTIADWTGKEGINLNWLDGYFLLVIMFFILMLVYIAPYLGIPELISGVRIASTQRILFFAVAAIPLDFVFILLAVWLKTVVLRGISVFALLAICVWASSEKNYHGYLYYELSRYRIAVEVMESIINTYPDFSYTVVSPTDSLYQGIENGWHEELLIFIRQTAEERYFLPSEYVFIFVEKRPLEYAQRYFFTGPSWLALEKHAGEWGSQAPNVKSSEISKEEAEKELMDLPVPFQCYTNWESRTIIESKAYYWCQRFIELYPNEMSVYYEDDSFVCYYFHQNPHSPFNLALHGKD
ncbi:hypothetical protein D1159_12345 [Pseudoflavonifractor sp. 524-17]|uniref:hypothetical protein n=1 Tax=Pseudoflavonifractor sp. 524-17 TaxID=2304577 RepID=UPI00137A69D3|nr:hypothetical protein [Pseudoflavonifractor sp. 524-17]NCE65344.1 hypothetical protein [Pseudoflavonifractor sp. 524-17]